MTKMSATAVALAVALGVTAAAPFAVAEEKLDPQAAYDKALNECNQLDNPDRRQLCRDKAKQQFEQAQKSGVKDGGMEKQKQY